MLVTDQFQTVKHTLKQLHTLHFEKGLTGKLNQWIHIEHMDLIGMSLIYVMSLINITIFNKFLLVNGAILVSSVFAVIYNNWISQSLKISSNKLNHLYSKIQYSDIEPSIEAQYVCEYLQQIETIENLASFYQFEDIHLLENKSAYWMRINNTLYFINTKSDNNYQFIPYKFIKEQCFFYQADIWQYLLDSLQQHSVIFYVNTDQTSNPSNFTHQQIKTITTLLHSSIKEQLISFIQVNEKDLHKEDALLLICQVYMELPKIKENENSAIDSSHSELIDRWMNQKIKDIQSQKELTQLNNLRDQQIQHYQENELNQHITQLIEQRTPL